MGHCGVVYLSHKFTANLYHDASIIPFTIDIRYIFETRRIHPPLRRCRNEKTIARFEALPQPPGGAPPILQYFSILLETEKLNEVESISLAKPVLAQNPSLLEKWLKEEKLHCSESLGDIVMASNNIEMALSIYLRAGCHSKTIGCFAQRGEYEKIVGYAKSVNYSMDYMTLLNQLIFR